MNRFYCWLNRADTHNVSHWSATASKDGGLLRHVRGVYTHTCVDRSAACCELLQHIAPDAHL